MDIETTFVMLGEASYTMHDNQDTSGIGMPNLHGGLEILEMCEIKIVLVKEELEKIGMKESNIVDYPDLAIVDMKEMVTMIAESECSFRF